MPISTDRPSVGTGPDLVPVHRIIVENGVTWSTGHGSTILDGPESLVRVGCTKDVEVRTSLTNMQKASGVADIEEQDIMFSTKVHIPSPEKWPVSTVLNLSAPTGSKEVSSGEWDPSLLLTTSHVWNGHLSSFESGNVTWATNGTSGRKPLTQLAFDGLWATTRSVTSYLEWAPFYSPVAHSSGYTVDGGALWVLGKYVQLDLRVGRAVDDGQPRTVVGAGFSFSFRRLSL